MIVKITDKKVCLPERPLFWLENASNTITFKIERYFDGHDLSECNIFVKFIRPDGFSKKKQLERKMSDSCISFDWTLGGDETNAIGELEAQISFEKGSNFIFNTEIFTVDISRSLTGYECEYDGEMSVPEFDKFMNQDKAEEFFESKLAIYYTKNQTDELLGNKQDVLIAGENVAIEGNTISVIDTTYEEATNENAGLMSASDKVLLQNVSNNYVSSINNKGGIVTLAGTIFRTNQPIKSSGTTNTGVSVLTPNNASTPVSANDVVISLNEQTYGNVGYVTSVYQGAITIEYLGNISGKINKPSIRAVYNITSAGTKISLQNLAGITYIDWGDGTIDNSLTHTYSTSGEYVCKIYGVTSIGNNAFYNCYNLTNVVIGNKVTSLGQAAFSWCTSLSNVTFDENSKITEIGIDVFKSCTNLESISIPDSVKIIASAFQGCTKLSSIVFGKNSKLNSIGAWTFHHCVGLKNVVIPNSVENMGSNVFNGCINLESITLPFIGEINKNPRNKFFGYVFGENNSSVPQSLKTAIITGGAIYDSAFANCVNLKKVIIGDGVNVIEMRSFQYCDNLTSIVIPESVTSIGGRSFYYCSNLTSITIPESVKSIMGEAFNGCDVLRKVTINAITPPTLNDDIFSVIRSNNGKIYVPLESLSAYKTAPYWSESVDNITAVADTKYVDEAIANAIAIALNSMN